MPNAIWKGHISFGLVSIPIILYSSEDKSTSVSFHMIDRRDNARIKYQRMNVETGKEVPWKEIGKAYAYDKEQVIPVEEGELEKIAGDNKKTIAIEAFINADNIDFMIIKNTYYLVPDKKGDKGYVILRDALKHSKKVGIAKLLISSKEYLAAVAVYKNALVIYTLRYADEILSLADLNIPSESLSEYKVNKKEIEVAQKLIQAMTKKWRPTAYKDEFKVAVEEWLEGKLRHKPIKAMKKRGKAVPANVVNFMDLLKKSLATQRVAKNDPKFKSKEKKRKSSRA